MTPESILDALGNIDPELIDIDADSIRMEAQKRRTFIRAASLAAAFLLTVGIVLRFALLPTAPPSGDPSGDMDPDKVYGAWFSGFFYNEMRSEVYLSTFPLLEALIERNEIGYTFNIGTDDISDLLGTLEYGGKTCEVYRSAVYPSYDSIIIVRLDGGYTVFVADGDEVQNRTSLTPSELMTRLDLAATVTGYTFGAHTENENPKLAIEAIENAVKSKVSHADLNAYNSAKYAEWCTLHGTDSVSFNGNEFSFNTPDARTEFALFYGSTIRTLFITTSRGFEHTVRYDPEYNLIMIANVSFTLSDAEIAEINSFLGI